MSRSAFVYYICSSFLLQSCSSAYQESMQEAVAWSASQAVAIELDGDAAQLERVTPLLAGKRVVMLGEPDHYVRDKYAFRLLWMRHLHTLGFRTVVMEMGRSDARRIDAFLQGRPQHGDLEDVALYGHTGDSELERLELDAPSPSPLAVHEAFVHEEREFWRALERRKADDAAWQLVGYDVDMFPGGAYRDIRERLAPASQREGVAAFLAKLRQAAESPNKTLELERLEALREAFELTEGVDATVRAQVRLDLEGIVESLIYLRDQILARGDLAKRWEAFQRREDLMFRRLDALLSADADAKIVVLGHNMHLSKDSTALDISTDRGESWTTMWRSVGTMLAERYPGQVWSNWMLYRTGLRGRPHGSKKTCWPTTITSGDELFEGRFSRRAGTQWIAQLPAAHRAWSTTLHFGLNDHRGRGDIARNADSLTVVDRAEAPRLPDGQVPSQGSDDCEMKR